MADAEPIGSIVIPAWNEATVIGKTLTCLLDDGEAGAPEIVVACNGCTDGTAEVAERTAGERVTVLDLPAIGKTGAIRAGERSATALPRLYLDADVQLSGTSARHVLLALRTDAIAARPPLRYDVVGASAIVRSYYRQRERLPSIRDDLCGAGTYGLSAAARARFGEFPDVVADDLFAARIVDRTEVTIVDCEHVTITVPKDARSLLRTLRRVYRGNRELHRSMPELVPDTSRSTAAELVHSVRRPRDVIDALIYAAFVVLARSPVRDVDRRWERDESSRRTP